MKRFHIDPELKRLLILVVTMLVIAFAAWKCPAESNAATNIKEETNCMTPEEMIEQQRKADAEYAAKRKQKMNAMNERLAQKVVDEKIKPNPLGLKINMIPSTLETYGKIANDKNQSESIRKNHEAIGRTAFNRSVDSPFTEDYIAVDNTVKL